MNKHLKQYNFLILLPVLVVILLGFYFLFTENQDKLFLLLSLLGGGIGLFFLLKNQQAIPGVFAFITPLSLDLLIGGGTKISLPIELLLLVMIFFFGLFFFIKKPQNLSKLNHPITWLLLGLIIIMLLSSLLGDHTVVSLKKTISQSIYVLGFFAIPVLLIKKSQKLKSLYFWYSIGMIIPIINSLIKHGKLGFVQSASVYTAMPFYDEHTVYGACLAFVIPFVFFKTGLFSTSKLKVGFICLALFFVLALLLSYSRAAWISLVAAGMLFIFIKLKGKFSQFMGILILLVGVFLYNYSSVYSDMRQNSVKYSEEFSQHLVSVTNLKNDASNRERINRWVCAVRMFKEKPVLGFGPGTYQFEYGKYQTNEFTTRISTHRGDKGNAHSEYLMFLSETGIIGFFIFLLLVLKSIQIGIKLINNQLNKEDTLLIFSAILGLTTFYVHGLFNAFSDSPKMAILFLGSLAILVYIDNKFKNEETKTVSSEIK